MGLINKVIHFKTILLVLSLKPNQFYREMTQVLNTKQHYWDSNMITIKIVLILII